MKRKMNEAPVSRHWDQEAGIHRDVGTLLN